MRHDRPARVPAIKVSAPEGDIYELDIWLTAEEIAVVTHGRMLPDGRKVFEPWLRITLGVDWDTDAGIEVIDKDDGA